MILILRAAGPTRSAYTLLDTIRRYGIKGTWIVRAQALRNPLKIQPTGPTASSKETNVPSDIAQDRKRQPKHLKPRNRTLS